MATSSSDESCSAPTDFNIFSSLEELNARSSIVADRCPLCCKSKRAFYCADCIQSGDFTYSNCKYPDESYAAKKAKLFKLKKERLKLLQSIQEHCNIKARTSNLRADIFAIEEHNSHLRSAIDESQNVIEKIKNDTAQLEEDTCDLKASIPKYMDKLCKMEKYIFQLRSRTSRQNGQLNKAQVEFKELCCLKINQLVKYIFPIIEVHQPKSEIDSSTEDTVNALAEATRMAYIRGKWVYTDNNSDLQYSIVEPLLPANGDYACYCLWAASDKEVVPGAAIAHKNPAHAITAALTYVTQMTYIMSVFLGVNLPHRLCYSDFCTHELTEEKFSRKVAKLNTNVLHLCFSQNVDPKLLRPKRTVYNLLLLLESESSDLGRYGPFVVNPELIQSMEESLASDLNISDSSDENSDENDIIGEWEKVHNISYEEMTVPTKVSMSATTTVHSHTQARYGTQPQTTTSITGGLVTSAAASVASWWRAALGK